MELHALCKCLCVPENIVDCTLNYFFLTNNWSGTSELGGVNELVMKLLMPQLRPALCNSKQVTNIVNINLLSIDSVPPSLKALIPNDLCQW